VSLGNGIFHQIVIRQSRMPQIDPRDFSLQHWTERNYYEVCSNPAIYGALESKANTGK
jgi:hypothetical protein